VLGGANVGTVLVDRGDRAPANNGLADMETDGGGASDTRSCVHAGINND